MINVEDHAAHCRMEREITSKTHIHGDLVYMMSTRVSPICLAWHWLGFVLAPSMHFLYSSYHVLRLSASCIHLR